VGFDPAHLRRLYSLVKMMPCTLGRVSYEQPGRFTTLGTHTYRPPPSWQWLALVNQGHDQAGGKQPRAEN
jgi:hypothetical protein